MIKEREVEPMSGWFALFTFFVVLASAIAAFVHGVTLHNPYWVVGAGVVLFFCLIGLFGFMVVNPNQSRVLVLFGSYIGSVKKPGFYYVNPFYSKKLISLRIRNFETGVLETPEVKSMDGKVLSPATKTRRPAKVNDRDGNPIEIAAVVVWRVVDTAAAVFEVDDFEDFVHVQSESALRNLASKYHYDDANDDAHSLRGQTTLVGKELQAELHERLAKAGVEVEEARISYLAYAPEIAAAMLQRQQASAVIAARQKIVEGAVGMVEMALDRLQAKKVVDLDPERKAAMVGNLLVVLCGHNQPQPVLNAGGIY
jgi:regulator of protease activity HflC (stomatin/prohibitin superfamily)